jgi:hypothetical protein
MHKRSDVFSLEASRGCQTVIQGKSIVVGSMCSASVGAYIRLSCCLQQLLLLLLLLQPPTDLLLLPLALLLAVCFRIDHQTGQQVAIKVIDLEEM